MADLQGPPGWEPPAAPEEPKEIGNHRLERLLADVEVARETQDPRLWMEINAHLLAWDISRQDLKLRDDEPPHAQVEVTPTESQENALARLLGLIGMGQGIIMLAGPGGTGKTTLMRILIERLPPRTVFVAAPTWAAALRLQALTGASAGTIHRLAKLIPIMDKQGKLTGFAPGWQGADVEAGAVVVLDEASMINAGLLGQLCAALPDGTQLVAVGDPIQLPPVSGDPAFNLAEADVMLTEVMRQRGGVLDLATWFRQKQQPLRAATLSQFKPPVKVHALPADALGEAIASGSVPIVICASNKSRALVNAATRKALGFPPMADGPVEGERVILYSSARGADSHAVNGARGQVMAPPGDCRIGSQDTWEVSVLLDGERDPINLLVPHGGWHSTEGRPGDPRELTGAASKAQQYIRRHNRDRAEQICAIQPAYAITCHKSQGSEWSGGVVLLEYMGWMDAEDQWRWGYTAITRFSQWVQFARLRSFPAVPRP